MKKFKILSLLILIGLFIIIPFKVNAETLLSSLEVEGIGSLGLNRKVFNLNYSTPYDYVNITATPLNDSVTVTGAGKVNINEGANSIVITASNGSATDTYTINLNVSKRAAGTGNGGNTTTADDDVKNPNTGSFINIAVIGGLVVSFALVSFITIKKRKLYRI